MKGSPPSYKQWKRETFLFAIITIIIFGPIFSWFVGGFPRMIWEFIFDDLSDKAFATYHFVVFAGFAAFCFLKVLDESTVEHYEKDLDRKAELLAPYMAEAKRRATKQQLENEKAEKVWRRHSNEREPITKPSDASNSGSESNSWISKWAWKTVFAISTSLIAAIIYGSMSR